MSDKYVNVTVSDGVLRGSQQTTNGFVNVPYYAFLGIPYAKPPVGELRFEEPQPVEPWTGVRDALKEGPNAPQKHIFFQYEVGEEDCLYINVYSKNLSTETKDLKPVMFYVHGGGFTSGSGDGEVYGPDFLLEQDIVLVTFNYRLGALGFLSLGNNKLPGNVGLKDQVQALEWVRKNIRQFGGDPDNVTIFGISAGGASVQYLLLSPLAKGLFHRAIIHSGTSLNPWGYDNNPKKFTVKLAKNLGYKGDTEDSDKIIEFLKSVPAMELVNNQFAIITEKEKFHTLSLPIRPTVEQKGPGKQFITQPPRQLLESGNFTKVPVIIGATSAEGNLQLEIIGINQEVFDSINNNPDRVIPLDMKVPPEDELQVSKQIKEFYFKGEPLSMQNVNKSYIELFGDITFYTGLADTLTYTLKHSSTPVYNYLISYENVRSVSRYLLSQKYPDLIVKGTPHGDDLSLLFKQGKSFPDIKIPPNDEKVIKSMVKMWAEFAKSGNPNYDGLEATWEETSADKLQYYDIGNNFTMQTGRIYEDRYKFWQELYRKYNYAY